MATYVPTNWKTGDVITATKLNNMETGIAGALQTSGGTMTGDITMGRDALLNGIATIAQSIALTSTSEKDLNKIIKTGIYHFTSSPDIINRPENTANFLLICVNTGSVYFQIYITEIFSLRMYVRIGNASSFGDWLQVNTSSVVGNEHE